MLDIKYIASHKEEMIKALDKRHFSAEELLDK